MYKKNKKQCGVCNGSGLVKKELKLCTKCNGGGCCWCSGNRYSELSWGECETCWGSGEIKCFYNKKIINDETVDETVRK